MQYTNEIKREILRMKAFGSSSREIADALNISKSGVNDFLNSGEKPKVQGPRVLFLDLETAPATVVTFGRFNVNITQDHVIKEGHYMLTAAWSWLGSDTVYRIRLDPDEAISGDDSDIAAALYEVIEEADVVISHNGIRFDMPVIKTRLLANGFPPHKTVKVLDTLKMAKHFRFPSNKLDSIAAYLKLGRKVDTGGIDLWVRCINGDNAALEQMTEYNDHDVVLLKEVYNKLAAFNSGTANFGNYYDDDKHHCPACGSTAVTETENFVYTPVSKFEEVVCNDCGHRSRLRTAVNTKEQRKKALVTPKVTG